MSATQSSFKFTVPRSRRDDPPSSKRAAEEIEGGALESQINQVWKVMFRNPGRSSKELALIGRMDRTMVGRRTNDLYRRSHAVKVQNWKTRFEVVRSYTEIEIQNDHVYEEH